MIESKVYYNFKEIEEKWQKKWEEEASFHVLSSSSKKKFYALVEFPYISGTGLHVGHPRSYTALDALCRKRRMEGYNVLFPIGWDAFGLPAENHAIKTGVNPKVETEKNIKNFKRQLKSLGYSFDWTREVNTTDPAYYKWTQWIFLQLYKKGLAYKAEIPINWCPHCKTGLANEEVINGRCERCDNLTIRKNKKQWMLKITAYADRLIDDVKDLDYIERAKVQQINWIGKSEGAEINFSLKGVNESLTVFTTRPDTIFGATYMVMAPEHPLIQKYKDQIENIKEIEAYIQIAAKKSDLERTELNKEKTGVEIKGIKAINPFNQQEIPIWISDYVLMSYGTGAIMAVPAHDQRDFEFAQKFYIPIIQVIYGGDINKEAYTGDGELINSDFLNGLTVSSAIQKAMKWAEEKRVGKRAVHYKLRDWVFSRQRYWGEPIPMVFCEKCGWVALSEKDLPLELPEVEEYLPTDTGESPLAKATDWVQTTCPQCGSSAERETDTMPQWAGSSWYFLRYVDPHNQDELASAETLKYWIPVDWYNGGMEHTTLHLLYSRFWNKFLYDIGVVPYSEPYLKRTSHGMILGENNEKMSKSRGNVVNPDDIILEYGADTLRVYEMFIGPFEHTAAWNTNGVIGVHRFLNKVFSFMEKSDASEDKLSEEDLKMMHKTIKDVSERMEQMKFNTAISAIMEYSNYLSKKEKISVQMLEVLIVLLNPFAPHLTEEIWQSFGKKEGLVCHPWPVADEKYLQETQVIIAIQINGKRRSEILLSVDEGEEAIKEKVLALPAVQKYIDKKEIKKIIIIPGKIINVVI